MISGMPLVLGLELEPGCGILAFVWSLGALEYRAIPGGELPMGGRLQKPYIPGV